MKQFSESFYTDDFDQEMLDFIKETHRIQNDYGLDNLYLRYSQIANGFWTTSNRPLESFGEYLTKNQFKGKIGMTDKKSDKQERIFKLVDKEGYSTRTEANKEFLEDYGIVVDGFYYYKGRIDAEGDLMEVNADWCLIDNLSKEFQYFEEVDSIPLPKNKPLLENYFVKPDELKEEQTNTFTKSMLVSGEHVVELKNGSYKMVLGERLVDKDGYVSLIRLGDDLKHLSYDLYDIVSVYTTNVDFVLNDLLEGSSLTLIWQRETPEQAQKRIRRQELEEKVVALRQELKQVENELQEL